MMMRSSCFLVSSAAPPSTPSPFETPTPSSSPRTIISWRLQSKQPPHIVFQRRDRQALQVPRGKGSSKGEVLMVDPLEAKRIAAEQMQKIQAKEKLERQRRIEAINGAWAMLGLTAGLVIEGQTGNSILAQLAGYWAAITGFFFQ